MKNLIETFVKSWIAERIKKHGLKMGVFVIAWFFIGHFVIPPLVATLGHWEYSWITYTPIDEIILFPIAYAILK